MAEQESWQIILGPVAAFDASSRIDRSARQPADTSIPLTIPQSRMDSPYRSKHSIDHLEFTQDEHNIVLAYLNIVKLLFVHPSCSTNLVCRYWSGSLRYRNTPASKDATESTELKKGKALERF